MLQERIYPITRRSRKTNIDETYPGTRISYQTEETFLKRSDMMSQIIFPQVREINGFLKEEEMKMLPFYVEDDKKGTPRFERQRSTGSNRRTSLFTSSCRTARHLTDRRSQMTAQLALVLHPSPARSASQQGVHPVPEVDHRSLPSNWKDDDSIREEPLVHPSPSSMIVL